MAFITHSVSSHFALSCWPHITLDYILQAAHCCIHIAGLIAEYLKQKGKLYKWY